jgi:catechol 2,3-dioxygenase-like lactoylglutathione lyase family enzyme
MGKGVSRMNGLLRLVLFTTDPEVSRAWYEKAGFEYLRGYDGMYWFKVGSTEIMLHPATHVVPSDTSFHVAVEDVDVLFQSFVELGFRPVDHQQPGMNINEPVTRPWGEREFELNDPDGHHWAFTQSAQ